MAYESPRSIEGPTKRRKVKRAKRTPTELGQTTPRTPRDERAKAAALRAARKGGSRAARASKQYGATTAESSRRDVKEVKRKVRRKQAKGTAAAQRASLSAFTERERTQRLKDVLAGRAEVRSGREIERERTAAYAPPIYNAIRTFLGDEPGATTPTMGEAGAIISTLGTAGAGRLLRAPKVAAAIKKPPKPAAPPAKGPKITAPKTRGRVKAKAKRAKETTRKAKTSKGRREISHKAGTAAAKKSARTARAATHPAAAMPGVQERGAAFVEGTVEADPVKAAKTTARAVPATLAFGATVLGDTYRAIKSGDLGPLEGSGKEAKKALKALEPLISGDPEKVTKATEEDVGYVFAPLAPRGLASAPGRAAGRGVRKVARKAGAPQLLTERGARVRASRNFAREVQAERHKAGRAAAEINKPARKVRGARSLRNVRGFDAGDVAPTLARYGVNRKDARSQLRRIEESLDPADAGEIVNVRKVREFVEANPRVLSDKNLWKQVDAIKKRSRQVETSPRATQLAQGRVLGVRPPEQRVPVGARPLTKAKTRGAAWKDYEGRRKAAAKAKGEARLLARAATEARGPRYSQRTIKVKREISEELRRSAETPAPKANPRDTPDLAKEVAFLKKEKGKPGIAIENAYAHGLRGEIPDSPIIVYRNKQGDPIGVMSISHPMRFNKDGKPIGADTSKVSHVSVVVHPDYRRQGIATKMAVAAHDAGYPVHKIGDADAFTAEGAALRRGVLEGDLPPIELPFTRVRHGRKQTLKRQAAVKRAEGRRLEAEAKELHREIKRYSKGDRAPTIRATRKHWDDELVREYVNEVKTAAKREGFEEPAWLAEPRRPTEGEIAPSFPSAGGRATHIKTGKAELHDVADRSLREVMRSSVYGPRVQRGLHRAVRRFLEDEAMPVMGKRKVITGAEWNRLKAEGKVDPRTQVILPSRQYKSALESEHFDLTDFHSDVTKRLKNELDDMADVPGTKYVVVNREAARELADQVNPQGGVIEKALTATGMAGTRVILGLSPAWLIAQLVAEGLQTAAAVSNPVRAAKVIRGLRQLKKKDPEGYEAFAAYSGESVSSFDQPASLRVDMDGGTQRSFYAATRAVQRTAVGRAILNTASLKTLGLFDRWKSGKYRSIILAAKADREFNGFLRGMSGMVRSQHTISKKLKDKPLDEQLAWMARNPKEMRKHLDYLDDVMGNWQAFTRFEREFAPAMVFYPYLRMSLRWTFWSFPKRHPVKAQILYLLAQQNAEELDKLLGAKPDLRQYAQPVLHDEEGGVDALLPGGPRFAAPGANVLVESIGEGNIAGLFRALNPTLSIPIYGLTGINPMSGEQDASTVKERTLLAANQFLSLPAPARFARVNRLGREETPASRAFDNIDPNRDERSFLMPFLPLSGERARMGAQLSRDFDRTDLKPESELGQFIRMVDQYGRTEAVRRLRKGIKAGESLSDKLPSTPGEDKEFEKLSDLYYEIKYGSRKKKSGGGGGGGAFEQTFGGGSTSSGKPGGAFERVFGS